MTAPFIDNATVNLCRDILLRLYHALIVFPIPKINFVINCVTYLESQSRNPLSITLPATLHSFKI
jgi:hypothetical protein